MGVYVGIDPSIKCTALTVYDKNYVKSFCVSCVNFSKKMNFSSFELFSIDKALYKSDVLYYDSVAKRIIDILKKFTVNEIFVEDYAYSAFGKTFTIGEFIGILKLFLEMNFYDYTMVSPTYIKKLFYKGNSTKMDMFASFCYLFKSGKINISEEYFNDIMNLSKFCIRNNKIKSPLSDILDSFYISYHRML